MLRNADDIPVVEHNLAKMNSNSSLSATSKRAKKKATVTAAAAAVATARSTPELKSAGFEHDEEKKHANPYIEVVYKKLRALRKKAQKLEKYNQMDKNELNADQLLSLEKKSELLLQLMEAEDIIKVLTHVDAEEAELAKRRQKLQESEIAARVAAAVNEANDANALKQKQTIQLLYALQNTLSNLSTLTVALTDEEYTALSSLRAYVTGAGLDAEAAEKYIDVAEVYLYKYLNREDEEFVNRLTYTNLHDLVERLLEPAKAPVFVAEVSPSQDAADAAHHVAGFEASDAEQHVDASHQQTGGSVFISFFNPSEVAPEEPNVVVANNIQPEPVAEVPRSANDSFVFEPASEGAKTDAVDGQDVQREIAAAHDSAAAQTPEPQANGVRRNSSFRGGRGSREGYRGRGGNWQTQQPRRYENNQQFQNHSPEHQQRVQQPRVHSGYNNRGGYQGKGSSSGFRGSPQPQTVRNQ
ncbi:hypothetical protein BJ742DRAFT_835159 [Cladochytrium replicatum]|nr:hypothetical protein BJ742DRAFT_835159 [Cladochytrium replicatum]